MKTALKLAGGISVTFDHLESSIIFEPEEGGYLCEGSQISVPFVDLDDLVEVVKCLIAEDRAKDDQSDEDQG